MVLTLRESATVDGDLASIWRTATDVAAWSVWDPHVLSCGFEGPFEVGAKGWTVTRIVDSRASHFEVVGCEPERSFTTSSPMPKGKMLITMSFAPAGDGRVTIDRQVEVNGPFVPVFRLLWAKKMMADAKLTIAALGEESHRRARQAGGVR